MQNELPFEVLLEKIKRQLYWRAIRTNYIMHAAWTVEDVYQELSLAAWVGYQRWVPTPEAAPRTAYMLVCATHRARRLVRYQYAEKRHAQTEDGSSGTIGFYEENHTYRDFFEPPECTAWLEKHLKTLTPYARATIYGHIIEERPAEEMGVKATVESVVRRNLEKLQKQLTRGRNLRVRRDGGSYYGK